MKLVIAAAGQGTRFGKLTQYKPKHMLPILGRPFMYYLLNNVKQAGFSEIYVVVGYLGEQIEDFVKQYDKNIRVVYQNKVISEGEYGTACVVKAVKPYIKDDKFIFLSGDNLYSNEDLLRLQFLADDGYNYIAGLSYPHPENYGVLKIKEQFVEAIIEKPKQYVGDFINTGLYKFTPSIFQAVDQIKKSSRNEYELTDAINILAQNKQVKFVELKDYWYDFGKPEDIKKLEDFLKK